MATTQFNYHTLLETLEEEHGGNFPKQVEEALQLAVDGHRGQFRDTRTREKPIPFIVHPVGTARLSIRYFEMVRDWLSDNLHTVVCVALTHDLLEDTQADEVVLQEVAGSNVRLLVEALTKPPAGVVGKAKEDRNREFVDQILNAGPTAVYVKLCDSMHNMSRPNMTPLPLYRKVVAKAVDWYLPMLSDCSLGHEFEETYRAALSKAEEDAAKEGQFAKESPKPGSLEEAIGECVASSTGKVLELHDISEILNRVCGTLNVSIWQITGKSSDVLNLVSSSDASLFSKETFRMLAGDTPSVLKVKDTRKIPFASESHKSLTIYMIPMQVGPGRVFATVLAFGTCGPPDWFTLSAAALIVQFLAHRLIVSESDRKAGLAAEAAKYGIQINTDLASAAGITPADLMRLSSWRSRCQQAIGVLRSLLDFRLLSVVSNNSLRHMVQIESRVKTADSIIRKITTRVKDPVFHFEQLEDIAGIRVICPTAACVREFVDFLQSEKAISSGCRLRSGSENSVRDMTNDATIDGYRAVHVILEVDTYLDDGGPSKVPCEVQLRTIFQDIWAKIAHDTLYTASQKRRSQKDRLRELGKELQNCETLAECILEEK